MEITEEKLYAAFGLDPNKGEKDPETEENLLEHRTDGTRRSSRQPLTRR